MFDTERQLERFDEKLVIHKRSIISSAAIRVEKIRRQSRHRSFETNKTRVEQHSSNTVHVSVRQPKNNEANNNKSVSPRQNLLSFSAILSSRYHQNKLNQPSLSKPSSEWPKYMTNSLNESNISSRRSSLIQVTQNSWDNNHLNINSKKKKNDLINTEDRVSGSQKSRFKSSEIFTKVTINSSRNSPNQHVLQILDGSNVTTNTQRPDTLDFAREYCNSSNIKQLKNIGNKSPKKFCWSPSCYWIFGCILGIILLGVVLGVTLGEFSTKQEPTTTTTTATTATTITTTTITTASTTTASTTTFTTTTTTKSTTSTTTTTMTTVSTTTSSTGTSTTTTSSTRTSTTTTSSATTSTITTTTNSGGGCFYGKDHVNLVDGGTRRIEELKVGDRIWSLIHHGNHLIQDEIILMMHNELNISVVFYTIITIEGHSVSLTGTHMLPVFIPEENKSIFLRASKVTLKHHLILLGRTIKIENIRINQRIGFNSPLTLTSYLFVNNISTSVFTDSYRSTIHDLHYVFTPIRVYYRLTRWLFGNNYDPFEINRKEGLHPLVATMIRHQNKIRRIYYSLRILLPTLCIALIGHFIQKIFRQFLFYHTAKIVQRFE